MAVLRRCCSLAVTGAVLTACGGGVSDELRPETITSVRQLAADAGFQLTEDDAGCVADDLGDERASGLLAAGEAESTPSDELLTAVVDSIVACVGTERLSATALAAQAPNASEESISCAAASLDADLFTRLVLDRFVPQPPAGPELDLDVGVALATCLTPEELLDVSADQ